jgi:dihydroxyacetone kinase
MPKPKKILNDPKDSVSEFLEGLLLQYPNHLVKLANHNVVLAAAAARRGRDHRQVVRLLSGGGSGHEPSHAGWIGAGMLSGAVCGGIFASPSVSSILAAIRAVAATSPAATGGGGRQQQRQDVLLVVKNYTGDRLNFAMAAERAAQEGIRVAMVVAADDCAVPRTKGITGARGVAGTVLIHKVAGAAAAAGKSLDEVAALARLAASRVGSLGVALNSVTVPGAEQVNDRLDEKTIEVGLGIHGEAGMKQSPLLSADEMAREMITIIQNHGRVVIEKQGAEKIVPLFEPGDEICVLVNNLGGTSNFEMSILARSCVKLLESSEFGAKATRVLVGSFMTSFDMHGVSLTIFNVSGQNELIDLLDAPTNAPAWSSCDVWKSGDQRRPSAVEVPEVVIDEKEAAADAKLPEVTVTSFAETAKTRATAAAQKLADAEPLLTKYDTIVGDGDCGITMKRGATEVLERLEAGTIVVDHPVPLFASLADAVSASMGGTSGVLLELMFRKISSTLARADQIGTVELCSAFQAGVDAVSLYGGAQVGSRTMLDALVPGASSLVETNDMIQASQAARTGADSTAKMKTASAGRSNYLSEETLEGTPDPGAEAVAIILESLASGSQ